ncbi:MAG: hypothetical protein KKD39_03745, partial [Candidatus Altiarchaeota archaeon]|nr:hypothetical protein [Candidatus Altiarchaeota archaeon]
VVFYLQFCFLIGSSPSSVDFKGSFTSFYKNLFSTTLFVFLLSILFLISQNFFDLGAYTLQASNVVGILLKFILVVLFSSISLLLFSIPLVYSAIELKSISGISKTIPLSCGFIIFHMLSQSYGLKAGIVVGAIAFLASIVLLKGNKKEKKNVEKQEGLFDPGKSRLG